MRTEGDEISLHNPIFAYYLDTRSMTRQRVEDMCDAIYKTFPKNVTIFIVQSNQPSKIECIYSENFYDIKNNNIINHIFNMIDGSSDLNELKVKIREFYIDKIIHEEKKI